jgi:alkylation response protein AidB-like acyl-CoA dehydrogenase
VIRDPESFNILLATVERLVREKLIPREAEVTELDEIPADIVTEMRTMGLFGLTIPEEYGGLGLTSEEEVLTSMALCYASPCSARASAPTPASARRASSSTARKRRKSNTCHSSPLEKSPAPSR